MAGQRSLTGHRVTKSQTQPKRLRHTHGAEGMGSLGGCWLIGTRFLSEVLKFFQKPVEVMVVQFSDYTKKH